jgi:hypothetical protein
MWRHPGLDDDAGQNWLLKSINQTVPFGLRGGVEVVRTCEFTDDAGMSGSPA